MQYTVPCTSNSAWSLASLDGGVWLTAIHVIFVALSVEDTAILNVDVRIFSALFTAAVSMTTPSLLSSCTSLAFQTKPFANAVQLNPASPFTEVLIGCGGIVIS